MPHQLKKDVHRVMHRSQYEAKLSSYNAFFGSKAPITCKPSEQSTFHKNK